MQPAAANSTDIPDLDRLLTEAQSGDRAAYTAILKARQSMVYSIARNFLRNEAHAEDIAQEVFLELFRNLQAIESGAHLVSWLRQVTGRKCIDQSRRVWFRRWVDIGERQSNELAAAETAPRDPLLDGRVQEAMGKLPEKTRLMMVLRYQEEMEPGEIAEAMQVPVGTVKSTIHRGLEQLRRRLASSMKKGKPWISLKTI
jgi:RNA polymerase sigma-70 factor, ECF subfamily